LWAFPSPKREFKELDEPPPEDPEVKVWLLLEPWWLLLLPELWWLLVPELKPLELAEAWSRASWTERAMEGRRAATIWATRRSVFTEEAAEAEKALEASSAWLLNWLEEEEDCWLELLLLLPKLAADCCWVEAAWAATRVACSLAARARLTACVMEGVSTLMICLTRAASSASEICWTTMNPFWPPVTEATSAATAC